MQLSTNRRTTDAWVTAIAVASVFLATAAVVQGTERAAPHAEEQAAELNRSLITQMRLPGSVGGSHIGISIHDVEETEAEALAEGAVVGEVREQSPASRAGLEPGDVVVEFDGERVRSALQLSRLVQETPTGRSVSATIVRDDNRLEVECTASGFLDSGLTVFASTPPRPARGGRVAPGPGFGSRPSPASTARCTSA